MSDTWIANEDVEAGRYIELYSDINGVNRFCNWHARDRDDIVGITTHAFKKGQTAKRVKEFAELSKFTPTEIADKPAE